jgi:glycosyltransferase involved in cell wall biosynthesis/VanZ family protein
MGEYLLRSKGQPQERRLLIMDFCDLDSDKWRQYCQSSIPPMSWIYRREAAALQQYEQALNQFFDLSIFVSPGEAELFSPLAPSPDRIRVVKNGVDHKFFSPSLSSAPVEHLKGDHGSIGQASQPRLNTPKGTPVQQGKPPSISSLDHSSIPASEPPSLPAYKPPSLIFTGAMDYQANVDGIVWFCREVLPELQDNVPELKFSIVGAHPAPKIQELASEDVVVTGYVDDIRDFYQLADICVVPLRMARGVQNKVLEAMAMGKPVVTTSKVQQGIHAMPERDFLLANTPQEFVRQVLRLIQDQDLAYELGQRGRNFVIQNFDWEINLKKLQELLYTKPGQMDSHSKPVRGKLNPIFFLFLVVFLLLANLWPMAATSPGATIMYRIDPGLQNFLHLPAYAFFGLVFADFLQHHAKNAKLRNGLFAGLGVGFCLILEYLQFFVPGRFVSYTDIIFNLAGLALGWIVYSSFFTPSVAYKEWR